MPQTKPSIVVRVAAASDVDAIVALLRRVYPGLTPYAPAQLLGQIRNVPEGQIVVCVDDVLVGYCATFQIAEAIALAAHSWSEITGGGYASRHDPDGDWLYGMEVFVDPALRGRRIGQRLYKARRDLCARLNLKGIVFGGRLPGLARRKAYSAEDYAQAVVDGLLRDPALSFQLRNGFELRGVLADYLPSDRESRGYASHLVWRNPKYAPSAAPSDRRPPRRRDVVRIAVAQYQQRQIASFEEFGRNVEYFVDVVADYRADFVVFPELFTLQLLSIENTPPPASEAVSTLTQYTERLRALLSDLAVRYNVNIIGGSHPTRDPNGAILNICYVCLRDGAVHAAPKIHPTPNERDRWGIQGGDVVRAIETDCGPIGVLICYDSEFPELARHLIDQGAQILFVPFCTDERQSYMRVRYCSAARAVENQCYVAMAGNVGNLPNVENMDIQYAQSCILTPCDFPFARDGIAADATPNAETVAFADIRLDALREARRTGAVQNLKDRRFDMYAVKWRAD